MKKIKHMKHILSKIIVFYNFLLKKKLYTFKENMNFNLSNEYRIKYYTNSYVDTNMCFLKQNLILPDFIKFNEIHGRNNYEKDILNLIKKNKIKINNVDIKYCPRDRVELFFDAPTLVKSREVSDKSHFSILMKLNINRHFNNINFVKKFDIPFSDKKNCLIWRGSTTGYGFGNLIPFRNVSRETLIKKFTNPEYMEKSIDIGLSHLVQEARKKQSIYSQYIRPKKTIEELLQYKYLLSVEGNDVATNLKWILFSNSVLFMPKPTIESWIMETHLVPYSHYIPIKDDFSDLEEKIEWCNKNQKKCLKIIKNAKKYIKIFLNEKNENKIMKSIVEDYLKKVQFI